MKTGKGLIRSGNRKGVRSGKGETAVLGSGRVLLPCIRLGA